MYLDKPDSKTFSAAPTALAWVRCSFTSAQVYRLVELSHRYNFHILEDDLYCDMQQRRTPRLAASGLDNVSYVSGFSKTLTANSRVSFAVLSPQLAARMVTLKMACGGMTSEMAEQIICTMLSDGSYAKHMRRTVDRLYESNSRVAAWLEKSWLPTWPPLSSKRSWL